MLDCSEESCCCTELVALLLPVPTLFILDTKAERQKQTILPLDSQVMRVIAAQHLRPVSWCPVRKLSLVKRDESTPSHFLTFLILAKQFIQNPNASMGSVRFGTMLHIQSFKQQLGQSELALARIGCIWNAEAMTGYDFLEILKAKNESKVEKKHSETWWKMNMPSSDCNSSRSDERLILLWHFSRKQHDVSL